MDNNLSFIHALVYSRNGELFDQMCAAYYKTYQNLERYVNPLAAKCQDKRMFLDEEEMSYAVRPYIPKPLWSRMAQATIKYFGTNAQRRLATPDVYDHGVIQLPGQFFSIDPFHDKAWFAKNYQFNGQLTSVHKLDVGTGEFFIPNLHAKPFKYAIIKKLSVKPGLPRRWEIKLAMTDPGFILNYTNSN